MAGTYTGPLTQRPSLVPSGANQNTFPDTRGPSIPSGQITGDTLVKTGPGVVCSVTVVGAGDYLLRDGTDATGTIIWGIQSAAGTSESNHLDNLNFSTGLFVDAQTTSECYVAYK